MFQRLGQSVARRWPVYMAVWGLVIAIAALIAPPLESVEQTGEFAFLPADSPSLVAERTFAAAFPDQAQASTVAVIVRRQDGPLTPADLDFVDNGNAEELAAAPAPETGQASSTAPPHDELVEHLRAVIDAIPLTLTGSTSRVPPDKIVIFTHQDRAVGELLLAPDSKAALVLIELPSEFLDAANVPLINGIERLLFDDAAFQKLIPPGLEISLSGTAVVGRDMLVTARDSAKATEHLTIILVVVLLILIYRAPLLALVPLTTVFLSVKLSMELLCWMAGQGWVTLFNGIESYVTVLVYGAGVDYCLFLIARYKEEIDRGLSPGQALADSIGTVGDAIAASAGTVICGIGMMIFAEFGKFRDAGIAISFGLVIVLLASLTLTPAMLRATGMWVFWPRHRLPMTGQDAPDEGFLQTFWDYISHLLVRRAWWLWLGSLAAMIPFAIVGIWFFSDLSYGLLTDLPENARSVVGTHVMKEHFPEGLTGPVTVMIDAPGQDFQVLSDEDDGVGLIARYTRQLMADKEQLQLDDVRSVAFPLGGTTGLEGVSSPATYRIMLQRSLDTYVGKTSKDDDPAHVTRLEIVTSGDPFSRDSIQRLTALEDALKATWRDVTKSPAEFYILGPTASIRDLKHVTDRDQVRIDSLATVGVFLILVMLLRRPSICVYLILSVLLSYLSTLGVTYLTFWAIDGDTFAGLDWKVPLFLFTILIAVGEDYNIFLMSRVAEEQAKLGRVKGIVHALSCTGRIISSCGIIMAGTFASLAAGSLRGMAQLGFALAFGVLLDTFVVRPILVPAWLMLVERGAFGRLSPWLGQGKVESPEVVESQESTV